MAKLSFLVVIMLNFELFCFLRILPFSHEFGGTFHDIPGYNNTTTSNLHYHPYIPNVHRVLSKLTRDDHLVHSLPRLSLTSQPLPKMYAGPIQIDDGESLFYWLFESNVQAPSGNRLIVWLNGGPGCSSMDGLFLEVGPLRLSRVSQSVELSVNDKFSWSKFGSLLFIDQPIGTGLSFVSNSFNKNKYAKSDADVNRGLHTFFESFFSLHPSLANSTLFLTGESHAGHYILSFASYLTGIKASYQISGVAIGNGWIHPVFQYDVSDFAWSMGLISAGTAFHLQSTLGAKCKQNLHKYYSGNATIGTSIAEIQISCFGLLDGVLRATKTQSIDSKSKTKLNQAANMYDVRELDDLSDSRFPFGHELIEDYLNDNSVRRALHVPETTCGSKQCKFRECEDGPYFALSHQDSLSVYKEFSNILSSTSIRILLYVGQFDLICNHMGIQRILYQVPHVLQSVGMKGWAKSKNEIWSYPSSSKGHMIGGSLKRNDRVWFSVVFDAGHMVPMDNPEAIFQLLSAFISDSHVIAGAEDEVRYQETSISSALLNFPITKVVEVNSTQEAEAEIQIRNDARLALIKLSSCSVDSAKIYAGIVCFKIFTNQSSVAHCQSKIAQGIEDSVQVWIEIDRPILSCHLLSDKMQIKSTCRAMEEDVVDAVAVAEIVTEDYYRQVEAQKPVQSAATSVALHYAIIFCIFLCYLK